MWKLVTADNAAAGLSVKDDFDAKYLLVSVVSGDGAINGLAVKKGDHFIVTNECDEFKPDGNMELIISAEV